MVTAFRSRSIWTWSDNYRADVYLKLAMSGAGKVERDPARPTRKDLEHKHSAGPEAIKVGARRHVVVSCSLSVVRLPTDALTITPILRAFIQIASLPTLARPEKDPTTQSKNITSLSGRDGKELDDALWERLQDRARSNGGSPSVEALTEVGDDFLVGEANTYGTSSFYDFLKRENKGVKAYVCNGSTCLVAGTQDHVHQELSKHFKAEEIATCAASGAATRTARSTSAAGTTAAIVSIISVIS